MEKLLTIAIPTYNRANYLPRAIRSILEQYDERVQVLISDNASTDNTQEVVKSICNEYPQIKYIRNSENIGPDRNFVNCYLHADGRFVLLLGDDDLIVENSLGRLLDFLGSQAYNCSLVFINHAFFNKKYEGIEHCSEPFWDGSENVITDDRKVFMQIAKYQLTYMSAFILRKSAFDSVEDPLRYDGISFIHTCIVFEGTKDPHSQFGAFSLPCVAQNVAYEDSGFAYHPENIFKVFGKNEEYVFCELAPAFGYDKDQMSEIYCNFISSSWPRTILSIKAKGNKKWKEEYLKYAKPALKKHPALYRKIRFYAAFPAPVAKILYKIKHFIRKEA